MAIQAGMKPLNYEPIDKTHNSEGFSRYIEAIQKGFIGQYETIKDIFAEILEAS